ncbi:MAG: hypothetical protein NVS4B9_27280 [Ktedonobacteraceae bacterium]
MKFSNPLKVASRLKIFKLMHLSSKRGAQRRTILLTFLCLSLIIGSIVLYAQRTHLKTPDENRATHFPGIGLQTHARPTPGPELLHPSRHLPTPTPKPGSIRVGPGTNTGTNIGGANTSLPSSPGAPALEGLDMVTNQAFGQNNVYVPNGWGVQKNRIVRTSTGDLFTAYIQPGSNTTNREWHLMHKAPGGGWADIQAGNAGTEEINIVLGANDSIHLFAWPGTANQLQHFVSTDLGRTFRSEFIPGNWSNHTGVPEQGYSGSGTNANGDIVFFQTGQDRPGVFNWTFYSARSGIWSSQSVLLDVRYTYAFFFPGYNNDVSIVAMRDAHRAELGYNTSSGFDYIFNALGYFYIPDVNHPSLQQTQIVQVPPQNDTDYDVTYLTDTYIDTQGRVHALYSNQYDGPHQAILVNGQVVKDVRMDISAPRKMRMTQDSRGHYYIISMDASGNSINVYPGTASDTDGTQLLPPTRLNISTFPGCTDDDFCHEPTFTVPRNGNAISDHIDGVYGNFTQVIHFRINLRSNG